VAAKPDSVPVRPETKREGKKYIKESIEPDAQLDDIKAEMFSRALHFEEEIWIDTLVAEHPPITDTLYAHKMSIPDSVYLDR
jgi:hypothetical protein